MIMKRAVFPASLDRHRFRVWFDIFNHFIMFTGDKYSPLTHCTRVDKLKFHWLDGLEW